jgi:ferritin-like metal-binding protein YciE
MAMTKPEEVFVMLLSHARQGAERAANAYQEISQLAEQPEIEEALQARAFVSKKVVATLDECFRLIGQQPVKLSGRLEEVFIEDFRRELNEIQSPVARHLFILSKIAHLQNLRIGEYVALTAAADATGHYNVGVLLESCLADNVVFVERTRRLIRNVVEAKAGTRVAA